MKTCSQCQLKYPDVLEFCPRDGFPLPAVPGAAAASSYDPIIGTTIDGRYAIEARLGEGGMGVVYRARHVLIDKPVAIKILRKEAAQDTASVQRFIQEAKSASKINHSNIVDITDFGVLADGHAYFVMEFLQGHSLAQVIHEGPLNPERVCSIAAQMARGLHAAHNKGIVHRDLKPENIFLLEREGQQDFVKIVDFGIAKVGTGQRLTQVGMVLGTPEYMSPEQATGQETDHRVDQYALGCIMYEMLTGVVPFLGERPAQTLTKHVFEAVVPPRQRKPELPIPASLEAVVLRTLGKKPSDRFPSMRELELALGQVEKEIRDGRVVVDDSRLYSARHAIPTVVPGAESARHQGSPAPPTQTYPQQAYASSISGAGFPAAVPVNPPAYPSMNSGMNAGMAAGVPSGVAAGIAPGAPLGYAPGMASPLVSGAALAYPNPAPYPAPGAVYSPNPAQPYGYAPQPAAPEVRATRESQSAGRARAMRSVFAAVGGALLVIVGVLVYILLNQPPAPQPDPNPRPAQKPEPVTPQTDPKPVVDPKVEGPAPVPRPPAGPVQISIRSSPSGATVYINGERRGQTPYDLIQTRGTVFQLELRRRGHHPYVMEMKAEQDEEVPIQLSRIGEKRGQVKRQRPDQPGPPSPPPEKHNDLRNPFTPQTPQSR